MKRASTRRLIIPVLLGLVIVGILILGFIPDDRDQQTDDGESPAGASSIWRCHSCARIAGQNWQSCKTITGRGTEQAARDLVEQRVCEEASDPATQCRIISTDCRELSEDDVNPEKS